MSRFPTNDCPEWCVADHADEDEFGVVRHRGLTRAIPAVLEGRGSDGPHTAELLVERSRVAAEETWVYVGDGWSGFSLSLESARRLSAALRDVVAERAGADRPGPEEPT